MTPGETQVCTQCNQPKPVDEFALRKETGKRRPKCRECMAQRKRELYKDNPEPDKKRAQSYRLRNLEKERKRGQKYYEENKEDQNRKRVINARKARERKRLESNPLKDFGKKIEDIIND